MAVVRRYIEILNVGVLFYRSHGVLHSQDFFLSMFRLGLWETSSGVVVAGEFAAGEGIMRMEEALSSEEENTDSQDCKISADHGHLLRNCLIGIWVGFSQYSSRFPYNRFHFTISPHSSHSFHLISGIVDGP